MGDNLVNGESENTGQTTLMTVNSAMLDTNFETSTDIESEELEKAKRKVHHNEVEKKRKYKLNDGINKLVELLPCRDSKRSKTQILEDTYNLVKSLQEKCDRLLIQNAPESEVDDIKRLMEENAKLKKENEEFTTFFRTMNITTDIKTHVKAVTQSKAKKNVKQDPPSDQLFGSGQNIVIQSPTAAVMGSPNLVTMPTNQMTIPIPSGSRIGADGSIIQTASQPGGMLLVAAGKTGNVQQGAAVSGNQVAVSSSVSSLVSDKPEAEGQSLVARPGDQTQAREIQSTQGADAEPSQDSTSASSAAITCTHEASNQNSAGQGNTTTADSANVTAVTQVITTPITTPVSQNTVLLPTGTGGVRLVQQQPVQQPQGQTVLIQLPGQPGQYVPVRIAPQVNQPQQVILTSQQGVNVIGTRGNAIQPKTPVKKKQPPQLKVKNICPLQPDSRKPSSPGTSQANVPPIAPNNTVTLRLPVGPTANQQNTLVMNNQGQFVLQQPQSQVVQGGMSMQLPVQVMQKPQVTQNVVYIQQQNGQVIPVILQQNSGVQQSVPAGTIIQGQQPVRVQVSQSMNNRPIQSAASVPGSDNQSSTCMQETDSSATLTSSQAGLSHSAGSEPQLVQSAGSSAASNALPASDVMNHLAVENSTGIAQNAAAGMQSSDDFAANDILAKATESIFANMSESSPPMQLGEIHHTSHDSAGEALVNDTVMRNTEGMFGGHQGTQPGIEIYDLPDDMDDSSTSKSKHKKKKKKKSKVKEKEKKRKDKDKDKSKKKTDIVISETASSDNNVDRESNSVTDMAPDELLSLMEGTINQTVMESNANSQNLMKNHVSGSMANEMPVTSNGNTQLSSFSAEALLTTVSSSLNSQRDGGHSISTTTASTESNGQVLFSSLSSLNFGSDILSSSMSVSGLPTYIDDEGDMVPTSVPMDGPSSSISSSKETTATASKTTPPNGAVSTGSALSLSFPTQGIDRLVSSEQKLTPDSKGVTTPTSESFHGILSPSNFTSISLLEQTSNQRDVPTSSLSESSQKDSSPINGYSSMTTGPAQHGWISNHSKASELARGIQPSKSQSPTSTASSSTASLPQTIPSASVTTTSVSRSQPNATYSSDVPSISSSKPSQNSFNLLSQPWLNQASTETLFEGGSNSLRQQQQLVDMLQGIPGLSDSKLPSTSQNSMDSITGGSDTLNQLPTPSKGTTSFDSFFGLSSLSDPKSSLPLSSNGDVFQGMASVVDSNKDKNIQNNKDGFLGLPSYTESTGMSSVPKEHERSPSEADQSLFSLRPELEEPKDSSSAASQLASTAPHYSGPSVTQSSFSLSSNSDPQKDSSTGANQQASTTMSYSFPTTSRNDQSQRLGLNKATEPTVSSSHHISTVPNYSLSSVSRTDQTPYMLSSDLSSHTNQNTSTGPSFSVSSSSGVNENLFTMNSSKDQSQLTSNIAMEQVSSAPVYSFSPPSRPDPGQHLGLNKPKESSVSPSHHISSAPNFTSPSSSRSKESLFAMTSSKDQPKVSSTEVHQQPSAAPSYSLANRLSALASRHKDRNCTQLEKKVPDKSDQRKLASTQMFPTSTQEVSRQPESRTEQSMGGRLMHPKSRALASASSDAEESRGAFPTSNTTSVQSPSGSMQQRQRNVELSAQRKSHMAVKTFSTTTIHRTLTADILEDGNNEKEQEEPKPQQPHQQRHPHQTQQTQQEQVQLPQTFSIAPESQQHVLPQNQVQDAHIPPKPSKKKRKIGKQHSERKEPPVVIEDKEDSDSVGRRELDKGLVDKFPWLAEASGKNKEDKGMERHPGNMAQQGPSTGPPPFSIQSISQSSSKKSNSKPGGDSGNMTREMPHNPPPYHDRASSSQGDPQMQLWNPSSFDSNVPSSTVPSKQPPREKNLKHHHQTDVQSSRQGARMRPDNLSQGTHTRPETHTQNRSGVNSNRPPGYGASSSDPVQAAVQAAVSKAAHLSQMSSHANSATREKTAPKNKKGLHPEVIPSSHMMRPTDIDDSLDFLTSTSNNSSFPSSMASSVNMDIFGSSAVGSSVLPKPAEPPGQTNTRRSHAQDKGSRVESSSANYLMSPDYDASLTSNIAQDNFPFQELTSPQMQQMQRAGNNSVNISFGESSNLGSGDDLDFSSLTSFQTSQPQRTPSDRQTPQNQTYSVPSGRSSVASMEPSPLQASPMNYNVQESGRLSQLSDMPHSNASSRGPPSVEGPQQQRRVTQSPMMQASHPGQGIKRQANDNHLMTAAKKASSGVQSSRRGGQQQVPEARQHSAIRSTQQSPAQSNTLPFHASSVHGHNQGVSNSTCLGSEVQGSLFPQSTPRNQETSRSKKRSTNPSDSIFSRETTDSDGSRSSSVPHLQESNLWSSLSGSQRTTTSSAESTLSTFLPNFSSSQSQSETSTSSSASIISNISPSRRLRHSEMPTYLPHLPGPILPSPPQSKNNLSRETDITPSFNAMFTPARTTTLHGVGMSNFPVFHEHQPPGSFNISKANPAGVVTPPFNYNIFNDSSPMTSSSHSEAPPLNHSIGLSPAVHIHGNSSLPVEDSVLHGNMGPRHPAQHFGNNVMRVESILGQNRTADVRPPFKMGVGVPPPMGMPQAFHGPTFGHSMQPF